MGRSRWLPILIAITAIVRPCAAQSERPSVVAKAGINAESAEDGINGSSPAIGADVFLPLGEGWTFDIEFWLPGYITTASDSRHRDVLWTIGVLRSFGHGRTQPFISFGISGGSTQDKRELPVGDTSSTTGYFSIGAGAIVRIDDRFSLVPEVRASLGVGSALLRPGIGVAFRF